MALPVESQHAEELYKEVQCFLWTKQVNGWRLVAKKDFLQAWRWEALASLTHIKLLGDFNKIFICYFIYFLTLFSFTDTWNRWDKYSQVMFGAAQ
jgi:hypothetical protein